MRGTWPRDRWGASTGDVLIFLATLSIGAALLYPAWSVRDFRQRVESAAADVAALRAAAREARDDTGFWPDSAPAGEAPPQLQALGGVGGIFDREGYTLGWAVWEVVDSIPAPPPADLLDPADAPIDEGPEMMPVVRGLGAIILRSAERDLLAELLERYSDEGPFVLDSTWVLVLPERADAPGGGPTFGF